MYISKKNKKCEHCKADLTKGSSISMEAKELVCLEDEGEEFTLEDQITSSCVEYYCFHCGEILNFEEE
jgi:hypothetical protein